MARRQSRPNIREVAQEAGVSVTTVSHALNGKGRLDIATRERVIEIANRMGYHPNRNARGLRSGRTDTIALLLPLVPGRRRQPIEIDFYLELLTASVDAAFQHDQATCGASRSTAGSWSTRSATTRVWPCSTSSNCRWSRWAATTSGHTTSGS
jgi:transcriptional regulator with XRE-family HTH domain